MKLFLLLFALKSALGLQLSYNVIEQTGKFCPGRDSCERGRNSRGPIGNILLLTWLLFFCCKYALKS